MRIYFPFSSYFKKIVIYVSDRKKSVVVINNLSKNNSFMIVQPVQINFSNLQLDLNLKFAVVVKSLAFKPSN
jgi:hypothetical protein